MLHLFWKRHLSCDDFFIARLEKGEKYFLFLTDAVDFYKLKILYLMIQKF